MAIKADIVLKKELLKGNPGGYYVPGVDEDYNLSFTPSQDDMPQVEAVNIKTITLDSFLQTNEYQSILDAEAMRASAEHSRITEENKRANAETNRASAEAQRATAEADRAVKEAERASAELGRQQAEQAREATFNAHMQDWESDVEIAVNNAVNGEAAREETFVDAMAGWNTDVNNTIDNANADVAAAVAEAEAAAAAATDAIAMLMDNAHANAIVEENTAAMVIVNDAAATFAIGAKSHMMAKQEDAANATPDNERPIVGVDVASITRTGKNIAKPTIYGMRPSVSNGAIISATTYAYSPATRINPNKTYTLSHSGTYTGYYVYAYDENMNYLGMMAGAFISQVLSKYPNAAYIAIGYDCMGVATDVAAQIEEGATATAYEAYNGTTLTAEMPEIIYGGNYDFATGLLTITHELRTIKGVEYVDIQSVNSSGIVNVLFGNVWHNVVGVNRLSRQNTTIANTTTEGFNNTNNIYLYFRLLESRIGGSTREAVYAYFKAQYEAGTPYQVCLELETPRTIQLTPQQLEMLKGYNNIYSDCGKTTLTYIADTKIYIDNKFNELQNAIVSLGSNV